MLIDENYDFFFSSGQVPAHGCLACFRAFSSSYHIFYYKSTTKQIQEKNPKMSFSPKLLGKTTIKL